ncbi:MAG: hypothetical protein WC405_18165 [Syntrophales bacterium]
MVRLDLAIKILIPLALLILVALSLEYGSFRVYLDLLTSQIQSRETPEGGLELAAVDEMVCLLGRG